MENKPDAVASGCAKAVLLIIIASISILLMEAIDWFIDARESRISFSMMREATSNLRLGMNRQEVEQFLTDAWSHRQCDYPEFSRDLYLFGRGDVDLSAILVLQFEKHKADQILTEIATVENYMLDSGNYRECVVVPP